MQIRIDRETLLPRVRAAASAVDKKPSVPILSHVLIDAGDSAVAITGTDLEVEMATRIDAASLEPGRATLPARKLADILKNLPEDAQVKITVSGTKATLQAGQSRFSLSTMDTEQFPVIGSLDSPDRMILPQRSLSMLVEKTRAAQAVEDVRYYLNGMLLQVREDGLYSVSTDGHRLSMAGVRGETEVANARDVIVPRKAIAVINRVIGERDDNATVEVTDRHLRVRAGGRCLTAKLIDGQFPDYTAVIPSVDEPMARIEANALQQAATRASILSDGKLRTICIELQRDAMRISSTNPDQEDAAEEMPIEYAGEPLSLAMNANYLLDALSAIDTDYAVLATQESNRPCVVVDDTPTPRSRHVIMPVRA